ncbi:endothelin-converting enzyme 1-like protein [Leptotrombidium deliense]|uniref:Endothelin-converting enzyme 1-like protein n=1 Tax=Leptotrombidium deliense TaxID=299467 RepID=A0A443S4H8_9ACAR|nr:endothelin-converting enzyme 1-like protein [Leptotrombidium deliense]
MKSKLKNLKWMQPESKQKALHKFDSIVKFIAFPDELLDLKIVENFYENLTLSGHFFEDYYRIEKFNNDFSLSRFRKLNNRTDWWVFANSFEVDAVNQFGSNAISIYLGILKPPYFESDRPNFLNVAFIGDVIAHELMHTFDDEGKQFDSLGNVNQWWDNETESIYRHKEQCVIEKYNNYTVKEIGVPIKGIHTQGENIADIAALSLTYNVCHLSLKNYFQTYKRLLRRRRKPCKLPGLNYTMNQIFWLLSAMNWCTNATVQYLKNIMHHDEHSSPMFRVIGPLSNHKQFAKSFNCPKGSTMNPSKKCSFW